jgi:GMP synthase-like glutamine amidotransferase
LLSCHLFLLFIQPGDRRKIMLHLIQNDPHVPPGILDDLLRERGAAFQTVRLDSGETLPAPGEASSCIVLGGFMGVRDAARYPFLDLLKVFMADAARREKPLLGICLGGQLLASALGAEVRSGSRGERGVCDVSLTEAAPDDPLFAGLPGIFPVFQWHGDSFDLPAGAVHLASSPACPGQAFRFGALAWGLQFHPEVNVEIAADWSRRTGAGREAVEYFRRQEETCKRFARRLLGNFLGVAGFR